MRAEILTLALIVGAFTWAFRYFPTRADLSAMPQGGPLSRFLGATGPAAIAKPAPSEGKNFFDTGVALVTDKPAAGVESIDTKAGTDKCWG